MPIDRGETEDGFMSDAERKYFVSSRVSVVVFVVTLIFAVGGLIECRV